eukprot:6188-Rhodomonas_salina.1
MPPRTHAPASEHELHALACRHCNHFHIPAFNDPRKPSQTCYAGKLLLGESNLQNQILEIEAQDRVYSEVSWFCERCHSVS